MACERCQNPNETEIKTYKITKPNVEGEGVQDERTLCNSCAQITRDAGYKLTGGKATEDTPSAPSPAEDATQSHTPQGGGSHSGHPVSEGGGSGQSAYPARRKDK